MRIGATVTRPVIGVVLISRLLGRRVATPVGSQQSRTGVNRSTRCALRRLSRTLSSLSSEFPRVQLRILIRIDQRKGNRAAVKGPR